MKRFVLTKGTCSAHCLVFLHYSSGTGVCQATLLPHCPRAICKATQNILYFLGIYSDMYKENNAMDNIDHEISDDDLAIEITNLDSTTHSRTPQELRFSPRARIWIVTVTVVSAALFLSFTFGNQLYALVYKPQPPKIVANISPSSITLQTVMNGVVYAVDPDRMVYAIRASNGSLIWQSFYPDVNQSISNNHITYTITSSGKISAMRTGNNSLLWSYQLLSPAPLSLTIVDNRVYVPTSDGNVYALDATRGSLLWSHQLKTLLSQPVLAAGNFVYVNSNSGTLYTLLASKGTLLWQHQIPSGAQLLTTANAMIYFNDSNITAFHASNGSLAWHIHLAATPVQPLVMADGNIYVATFDNSITAFRGSNGSLLWHHLLPALAYEPIVVSDAIVYIHASDSAIYTLSAARGAPLWSKPVSNIFTFVVVDGIAYIVTINSKMEALLPTGMSIWQRQLPSSPIQPLLVSGGVLYTGTASGTIYAVRMSDSALLWHYATQAA
jgi:outer membrane protein assembly factor BamB